MLWGLKLVFPPPGGRRCWSTHTLANVSAVHTMKHTCQPSHIATRCLVDCVWPRDYGIQVLSMVV
jgi:hypothetical protein